MKIKTQWVSSLEKIFAEDQRSFFRQTYGTALLGEKYHIQLAIMSEDEIRERVEVIISSPIKEYIKPYTVKSVPVLLTSYPTSDDDFLSKKSGLYPDLLTPLDFITVPSKQWRSIFFEINIPENLAAGAYPITVTLKENDGSSVQTDEFMLEVIGARLPEQTLKYTDWFHNDCLCEYYKVPVFSEKYWKIVENYLKNAAEYGVNMILTPIFTPPLDTEVGKERLTVQLVDIKHNGGKWEFDFSRLDRYIKTAISLGIKYFEFSHFFTQWGAEATPKIIFEENDDIKKFGWHTPAQSMEYKDFLFAFIPKLKEFLTSKNLLDKCYFHISDEPKLENIDNYSAVYKMVEPLLSDCNIIDALSDYEFYKSGIIKNPIPSNDFAEQFFENGVEAHWTYYCCLQQDKVSNRMIAMPSYRTRILGLQLFKYKADGFLQWGYNYWYNRLSRKLINPFFCTDSEEAFPAGDPFIVYPGEDGTPLSSIRELVFFDGLQDMRALQLLSSLSSFEETVNWLDGSADSP